MNIILNPANRYDERTAVADFGDTLDEVRANGLLSVCLGCGSTVSIDGTDPVEETDMTGWGVDSFEERRRAMADLIDFDAIDCCPDADRINY